MAGVTHRNVVSVDGGEEGARGDRVAAGPGVPSSSASGPAAAPVYTTPRQRRVENVDGIVNVRGRVALGALLGFFGTLAIVGLFVNGYRSFVPYASVFAFLTLALIARVLVGDHTRGNGRVEYLHRRYAAGMSGRNGRIVGPERVQYTRLNQRLSLMDRDFTPADYDLLLELDDNSQRFRRFLEGASKGSIERLPTYIYKAEHADANVPNTSSDAHDVSETKTGCTICLEEFCEEENVRILPCFHQFHVSCVDRWLLQQAKCPVCKFPILDIDETLPVYPENTFEASIAC
eukprot:CAMPEP_0198722502 /NCGR_PEP_ID=MMETSP1475-20131203/214_1 /TAXON_ID= ORGANISM="Unidentified sp., Strain CCMP1999" /NCGR_SAMPLE_ID=MMETSP1475 /ASSEMBLY_ACC=CAM_ASM_001111 /LENGTH=289 /DNA_ID=CAMNT_0044483413 /DNA_START=135 /DNA_END=1004 /DNA_ORIENTATION=-